MAGSRPMVPNRDYAAPCATAAQKWFWNLPSGVQSRKSFSFCSQIVLWKPVVIAYHNSGRQGSDPTKKARSSAPGLWNKTCRTLVTFRYPSNGRFQATASGSFLPHSRLRDPKGDARDQRNQGGRKAGSGYGKVRCCRFSCAFEPRSRVNREKPFFSG